MRGFSMSRISFSKQRPMEACHKARLPSLDFLSITSRLGRISPVMHAACWLAVPFLWVRAAVANSDFMVQELRLGLDGACRKHSCRTIAGFAIASFCCSTDSSHCHRGVCVRSPRGSLSQSTRLIPRTYTASSIDLFPFAPNYHREGKPMLKMPRGSPINVSPNNLPPHAMLPSLHHMQ